MSQLYILSGPAGCGNQFGVYHASLVPEGRWCVVRDGEYANGGSGPSTVDGVAYRSLDSAKAALARLVSRE